MKTIYDVMKKDDDSMLFEWSAGSKRLLAAVHPDLQKIYDELIRRTTFDLSIVSSTVRTIDDQIRFVKKKVSKTYNSRHLHGMAVDCVPWINGKQNWTDLNLFNDMNDLIQKIADEYGIKIRQGRTFHDHAHNELLKSEYPDKPEVILELKKRGLIK